MYECVVYEDEKLNMEPIMVMSLMWKLKGVVDTGSATHMDTRRSITGYLIYFCEALISWKSRLQKKRDVFQYRRYIYRTF